jgi:adenylate cyclase
LSLFISTRGEVAHGAALAERALALAEGRDDEGQQLAAHVQIANPLYMQGKFRLALSHAERAIALYDSDRHRGLAFMYGNDQGVQAFGFAAWSQWLLGQPDRALTRAREGVALGRRIGHPFSLAFALYFEAFVRSIRREVAAQREVGAELIALASAQGFPFWLGLGKAWHAAARALVGQREAVDDLMRGIELVATTGSKAGAPGLLHILVEAQQAARMPAEALGTAETALAIAAATGQPFFDGDLHRLKAELVLESGGSADEAETLLQRALDITRGQESRSFALRAATSLARLLRDQGRVAEARAELAPVYDWFTEGFDTRDLKDAKALLEELG